MPVKVELEEDSKFLKVTFGRYESFYAKRIKNIPGARFNKRFDNDPHWRLAPDLESARKLRSAFGSELVLGPRVKRWAKEKMARANELGSLSQSDSADLVRLPDVLPKLAEAIHLGPKGRFMTDEEREIALDEPGSFQTSDVSFMANSPHPMNTNQPGLGKTLETIAAVYEAGIEHGPHLVVAPLTSLEVVWEEELTKYQRIPVLNTDKHRQATVQRALQMNKEGKPFWLLVNPQMIQYRYEILRCQDHIQAPSKECHDCDFCETNLKTTYPQLYKVRWNTLILDEFHKMGLGNPKTLTYKAMRDLKAGKKIGLSGTPMGGKPIKMYGVLSFLHPEEFTSKWRFARQWLEVDEEDHRGQSHQSIGGIREDRHGEFYKMLSQYMVRRTKGECIPWLPPKQYVEIWATLEGRQKSQYLQFAKEAEIRIDEEELTATSILAEYTRLKQFADSEQTILGRNEEGKPILVPTIKSCKMPHIYRLLEERGILPNEEEGDEQVIIFSQFSSMVDMICDELQRKGYPAERLTGAVPTKDRADLIRRFQVEDGLRVLVMNTMAGGVAITLDRASTVIFVDETWNPDDQIQAEDRTHRGSTIHQVTIYYIRSKDTIEEMIEKRVLDKRNINRSILDLHRMGIKSFGKF